MTYDKHVQTRRIPRIPPWIRHWHPVHDATVQMCSLVTDLGAKAITCRSHLEQISNDKS